MITEEQQMIFQIRQKAVEELQKHIGLSDEAEYLWKAVIAYEGYRFTTMGHGKDHRGATEFLYKVSRSAGAGGRHYEGTVISGYGNEIFISGKERSVSRSTVEKGLRNALAVQEKEGCVRGPRKLNIPGAHSYLYSMFLCFGIIRREP